MAGITNISHSPADKRGMGLTFLGMMNKDNTVSPLDLRDYVTWQELQTVLEKIRTDIEELQRPWYSHIWLAIKRLFNNKGE
jgi:hypothetical protein